MENEKRKPIETILTRRSEAEIVKDLVESKKEALIKKTEENLLYQTYRANRRRDENEVRYGRRKRY